MTSYSGALLAESLRPDAVLDGIPLGRAPIPCLFSPCAT
jgi:hypothetical protein